ncbi:hypothetical protein GCM10009727_53450 [Actinomadura napierensis]|uniref:SseB protein N-terminal domain-containing protein n=2 Tax=Actinomadura napierensis TaxID=267854 RepID=A0ABP5LLS5_9ACTN
MHSLEPGEEQDRIKRQGDSPTRGLAAPITNSIGLDVFVPIGSDETTQAGDQEVYYEVRSLSGGGPVLPIYTSESILSTTLGEEQRFAQTDIIELLRQVEGRVPLVVNPVLAAQVNSPDLQAAQYREDGK